jgi:hypothetical protein
VLFLNRDRQVVAINAAAEAMLGQERGETAPAVPDMFTAILRHDLRGVRSCSPAPGTGANRKDRT